jgi:hypothetical protein
LLEHLIQVGGYLGHDLQDVPVLDDLTVLVESEDVDPCAVMVTWPDLAADDVVNEGLLAVADMRVLLVKFRWRSSRSPPQVVTD